MKLIYLLTGILLLMPLASQAKVGRLPVPPGKAVEGVRVIPKKGTVQKVFKTVYQIMEDAIRGLSKETQERVKGLYKKAVGVAHKCAEFVGGRSASAQEQNVVVTSEKMTQSLQNAVLQSPKWGAQAKANLEAFMKGIYTGSVFQVVEDVWDITSEEEAINKLAEIETACAI